MMEKINEFLRPRIPNDLLGEYGSITLEKKIIHPSHLISPTIVRFVIYLRLWRPYQKLMPFHSYGQL